MKNKLKFLTKAAILAITAASTLSAIVMPSPEVTPEIEAQWAAVHAVYIFIVSFGRIWG